MPESLPFIYNIRFYGVSQQLIIRVNRESVLLQTERHTAASFAWAKSPSLAGAAFVRAFIVYAHGSKQSSFDYIGTTGGFILALPLLRLCAGCVYS